MANSPLLAHVAQTGHILRVKNRPGNVHDSKQSVAFLRDVITGLRTAFGRRSADGRDTSSRRRQADPWALSFYKLK